MKLKTIPPQTFTFRRSLPKNLLVLGPDGCSEVFIEIKARAGGGVNPEMAASYEAIEENKKVLDVLAAKMPMNIKKEIAAQIHVLGENSHEIELSQIGALYDSCVVSWSTNICDQDNDGAPLKGTRDNFISLADMKIVGLTEIFGDFAGETSVVAGLIQKQDEETVKN